MWCFLCLMVKIGSIEAGEVGTFFSFSPLLDNKGSIRRVDEIATTRLATGFEAVFCA